MLKALRKIRHRLGDLHRSVRVSLAAPVSPRKWVFLVGCYNSGTTLLAKLMGGHPEISALPEEGQYLTDQLVKDYALGLPRMWCKSEPDFRWLEDHTGPDINRIKKEWAIRLPANPEIVLEKTPANIARMRWLQRHFSTSYFVAIVRNGYAVSEGIRRKAEPAGMPDGWPIADCARQWRRSCEVLSEDATFIGNLHVIRYEQLVAAPQETLRGIWRFLGVSDAYQPDQDHAWSVHERTESITNMNHESIGRLSSYDIELIEAEAGEMLDSHGYRRLSGDAA